MRYSHVKGKNSISFKISFDWGITLNKLLIPTSYHPSINAIVNKKHINKTRTDAGFRSSSKAWKSPPSPANKNLNRLKNEKHFLDPLKRGEDIGKPLPQLLKKYSNRRRLCLLQRQEWEKLTQKQCMDEKLK